MTLTFELDQDRVNTNLRAKHLGQRSFSSKVTVWTHRHTHTLWTDCSIWTSKVVGNQLAK